MNESPISVVLKSKRRKTKAEIRVCDKCGVPLIWTFAFSYCESYCLNCGAKGGMLETGNDVPLTRELAFQNKIVQAIWKVIYGKKGFLPNGKFGISNCKKDNGDCHNHRQHLTKAEEEYDEIARKYLKHFSNNFLLLEEPNQ